MNYQNEMLPEGAIKVGSTPSMNEETVVPGILKNHLAPKGKYGYLVVEQGTLQFVWEDDRGKVLDADQDHPIVIFPERFHHVEITGKVQFRVEFYQVPNEEISDFRQESGDRPGQGYVDNTVS